MAPGKVTELMLLNLNEQAVKKYKSEHKLAKMYSGTMDLFKYEEVVSFANEDPEESDSWSESEEEEVWSDDDDE